MIGHRKLVLTMADPGGGGGGAHAPFSSTKEVKNKPDSDLSPILQQRN